MELRGDRVVLRPLAEGDVARIVELGADPEERRLPDGRWRAGVRWWKAPGSKGSNVEVVGWGRSGPNELVTLNALRVLHAASH